MPSTGAAPSTLKQDLGKSLLNDDMQEGCSQSVSDPARHRIRAAGVLKYNRESDNHRLNIATVLPESQPSAECHVQCEHCGQKARPSLDLTWVREPETVPLFCCSHRQQLCELMVKQRRLVERKYNLRTGRLTTPEDEPTAELFIQSREMEERNNFMIDLPSVLRIQPELRVLEDYSIQLPVVETYAPVSKVFSFRLSCAPQEGCWAVTASCPTESEAKWKVEEVQVPYCDCKPLQFGICHQHHQDGTGSQQKYYSNGMKFLTVFPDGSAQVLYPLRKTFESRDGFDRETKKGFKSSRLAVIVVVTGENGRVCIVHDDTPDQAIRAVFQSDGRGTCYHSNGNIWLTMDRSGGQRLDQEGASVHRWTWSSLSFIPTSLRPIFLSINRTVGLRVLGKEQVFVSFLARGRQTKFSVGAFCNQDDCKRDGLASRPSVLKEELIVLAAQIKIQLVIQQLHQYLMTPSHPKLSSSTLAPHLHALTQRLLEVCKNAIMSESEKDFIHRCLQYCL